MSWMLPEEEDLLGYTDTDIAPPGWSGDPNDVKRKIGGPGSSFSQPKREQAGVDPSITEGQPDAIPGLGRPMGDAGGSTGSKLSPEYLDAIARLKAQYEHQPQRQKPNIWQKIGTMAVGAAGGAVNAAGRTHIDQGQIDRAENALSGESGYQNRRRDWQQRIEAITRQAELEAGKTQAERAITEADRRSKLTEAQTAHWQGQEARDRAAAELPHKIDEDDTQIFYWDPRSKKILKLPKAPKVIAPPATIAPGHGVRNKEGGYDVPVAAEEKPPRNLNAEDVLMHKGDGTYTAEEEAQAQRIFEQKHREPPDRGAQAEERQRRRVTATASANEKTDLSKAEKDFATTKAKLDAIFDGGKDTKTGRKRPDKSDPEYAKRLTALEDGLLAQKKLSGEKRQAAMAAVGEPYNAPEYPHPSQQRKPAAAPAGPGPVAGPPGAAPRPAAAGKPQTVSRAKLKAAAIAAGRQWDDRMAEQIAKQKGYVLVD